MTADGDAFNVDGEDPVELPAGARPVHRLLPSRLREQSRRTQPAARLTRSSAHGRASTGAASADAPGIDELRVRRADYVEHRARRVR
jgi:hypothetical protein